MLCFFTVSVTLDRYYNITTIHTIQLSLHNSMQFARFSATHASVPTSQDVLDLLASPNYLDIMFLKRHTCCLEGQIKCLK